MKVVVASGNKHKIEEIGAALAFTGWEFVPVAEMCDYIEPEETGETFDENARIKALAARNQVMAEQPEPFGFIADDSGLEVDALDGRPGVHSHRYAGPDATDGENTAKLLVELEGVPAEKRSARFRSCIAFIAPDGTEVCASGACEGRIGYEPQGTNGFGYDPVFFPEEYGGEKTMAELSMDEKNAISHRGRALIALRDALAEQFATDFGDVR